MKSMTNLGDMGNREQKIELLEPQISSSKFTFPHGFSACHLDYLGNCGVHTQMGVRLPYNHCCTATKNSSFVGNAISIQICGAAVLWVCLPISFCLSFLFRVVIPRLSLA